MRKTKIVCTLGPTVDNASLLTKLCVAGMNVARFNFSHGDYEEQTKRIEIFKEIRSELKLPIPMMLDTKGPEIRIGKFINGEIKLSTNDIFTLMHNDCEGDENKVFVNYPFLYNDVKVGSKILINDGLIELEVLEIIDRDVKCKVLNGGKLTNKKSVNVPDLVLNLPLITEKDKEDIIFGIQNGFDIIATSFVRKPEDILAIKEILKEYGGENIKIIAKIENHEGVINFDKILEVVDGIMVARGDLGVEIPMQEVPLLQKEFVNKCIHHGKTVIIATQMLESMISNPRPTRAEVSDIANAVLDGTAAIMLSGETASGNYPIECVQTMGKIAESIENSIDYWKNFRDRKTDYLIGNKLNLVVGHSLCEVAMQSNASAIFSLSSHGNTPNAISSFRPNIPIFGVTSNEVNARQLNLTWGVTPILVDKNDDYRIMIREAIDKVKEQGHIKDGDTIVVGGSDTRGIPDVIDATSNKILGGIYKI